MRETAKTMLAFLCIGVILVAAIVANFKYEEWRAEKVAAGGTDSAGRYTGKRHYSHE